MQVEYADIKHMIRNNRLTLLIFLKLTSLIKNTLSKRHLTLITAL